MEQKACPLFSRKAQSLPQHGIHPSTIPSTPEKNVTKPTSETKRDIGPLDRLLRAKQSTKQTRTSYLDMIADNRGGSAPSVGTVEGGTI